MIAARKLFLFRKNRFDHFLKTFLDFLIVGERRDKARLARNPRRKF